MIGARQLHPLSDWSRKLRAHRMLRRGPRPKNQSTAKSSRADMNPMQPSLFPPTPFGRSDRPAPANSRCDLNSRSPYGCRYKCQTLRSRRTTSVLTLQPKAAAITLTTINNDGEENLFVTRFGKTARLARRICAPLNPRLPASSPNKPNRPHSSPFKANQVVFLRRQPSLYAFPLSPRPSSADNSPTFSGFFACVTLRAL